MGTTLQETLQMHISGSTCMFITFIQQFVSGGPVDWVSSSNDLTPNRRQVINWTLMIQLSDRPISEFPSQTCALLLLSAHNVCHVTIAHFNDSNETDTRVRVRCNDSDVTDRKQSRVCNDSTVTDMSWAIATCDGHINRWQSKVWEPQNLKLHRNCPTLNVTWLYMRGRYGTMCRTKKLMYFITVIVTCRQLLMLLSQELLRTKKYACCYRKNVTDQSCYFDQCDGLIVAIVIIGTENRVWMLFSLHSDGHESTSVWRTTNWSI